MEIRSLGRQTDLIFARFSGYVKDLGNYTLVQTPSNPGYHWGNYIIFDRAPKGGDYEEWKQLFDNEFSYYKVPHHYVFTWDTINQEEGETQEFVDNGFEFDSAIVLTTKTLNPPEHLNNTITIRKIITDDEWEAVIRLQTLCADPKVLNDYYIDFKREQIANYRKMSEVEKGSWFGAFIRDELVGDLGIFFDDKVARYQNVGTHPDYRKQGICGTLVYEAGKIAFADYGINYLVMEADPDYHAARIYESVGFKRTETNYSLSWWRGDVSN